MGLAKPPGRPSEEPEIDGVPAGVVTWPAAISRMVKLSESVMKRFPPLSTVTPAGDRNVASATLPSAAPARPGSPAKFVTVSAAGRPAERKCPVSDDAVGQGPRIAWTCQATLPRSKGSEI